MVRLHAPPPSPAPPPATWAARAARAVRCGYCRDRVGRGVRCGSCGAVYHADCRRQLGRCGTLGCAPAAPPAQEPRAREPVAQAGPPPGPRGALWPADFVPWTIPWKPLGGLGVLPALWVCDHPGITPLATWAVLMLGLWGWTLVLVLVCRVPRAAWLAGLSAALRGVWPGLLVGACVGGALGLDHPAWWGRLAVGTALLCGVASSLLGGLYPFVASRGEAGPARPDLRGLAGAALVAVATLGGAVMAVALGTEGGAALGQLPCTASSASASLATLVALAVRDQLRGAGSEASRQVRELRTSSR